jgi:hypothetical protein
MTRGLAWKLAAAFSLGALATGGIVLADGGDAGQVHACLIDGVGADGRPNTIILGSNDACPGGSTPKHWSVQGPPGAQGLTGPAGPAAVPNVLVVTKSKGPNLETHKTLEARCPSGYAAVSGSAQGSPTRVPGTAKILYYLFEENRPITTGGIGTPRRQIGWRAKSHSGFIAEPHHIIQGQQEPFRLLKLVGGKWKLTVTAICVRTGLARSPAASTAP